MKKKGILSINTVLIGIVLVIALGLLIWQKTHKKTGGIAAVYIGEEKRMEIDLSDDGIYRIDNAKLPVTLEVKDGAIRFINSVCPDHICEGYGFINVVDESAICMPAQVFVVIDR